MQYFLQQFSNTSISTIAFILLLGMSVNSCDLVNPEEQLPSYLFVNEFEILPTSPSAGSISANITEVWLTLDGNFMGAYPLPATIPLLTTGTHTITLQAGIRDNGISSSPEVYPFYTPFEQIVDLKLNETVTINPSTQYTDRATFVFNEPFEVSDHLFRDIVVGDPFLNRVIRTDVDRFEGNASALIQLDLDNPEVLIATNRRFRYPDNTNFPTVYLELNYKSEALVAFGIIGYDGITASGNLVLAAGFRPKENWNKIYFNLSRIFADNNFFEYQVVFQAAIPQENGTYIQENASIWLDNIKLIQF